jgi:hypothetical protein
MISRLTVLVLASLVFAGCASTPTAVPPGQQTTPMAATAPAAPLPPSSPVVAPPAPAVIAPPPPLADVPAATIVGSEESSTMLDNFTAFVAEIDGVPVAAGREGWNKPLLLKPGLRHLTLGFRRGVFSSQAIVELNVESRASYQVHFTSDAELFGKNSYCEFWIVNVATNQPASTRVRSGLTRIEPQK